MAKIMKAGGTKVKKQRVGGSGGFYNWCTEHDIFMLHGFRDLDGNAVSFPPYQSRAAVQWTCTIRCVLLESNLLQEFQNGMSHK